jgi:hypothetical protein
MARKIIIDFSAQPTLGKAFEYSIFINGVALVYSNGANSVVADYISGSETNTQITLQPILDDTINNTLTWLTARYVSSAIVYNRVGNTIEVDINSDQYVTVVLGTSNINISTSSEAIIESGVGLRYYFQYKNIVGDDYLCQIAKKDYTGVVTEIFGKATIDKGSVKDHLEPIRGGGMTIELEASLELTLEDLYSENEQDFTVKLYKNNKLVFTGYLNPEGVYQSFVRDNWIITLDCVDGLGSLANLSFVDPLGFPFTGKMKGIDIVYYCLNRSGIVLPINVSINTTYNGLFIDADTEILSKIYLNANRFQKTDGDTIMSCEEVLKSVLDLFCACITQQDGEWYIYKPNELFQDRNVIFKMYDINNVYLGRKTVKVSKVLGSQINNFYPHHCNGDQKIQIKGSNSAFRINYKYGFVSSLLPNPRLTHDSSLNYDGWTITDTLNYVINDPTKKSGLFFKNGTFPTTNKLLTSDGLPLLIGDLLTLKIKFSVTGSDSLPITKILELKFKIGTHYLKYVPDNGTTPADAVWTTNPADSYFIVIYGDGNYQVDLPKLPETGSLISTIIGTSVYGFGTGGTTNLTDFDLIPTASQNEVGEFHTVSRASRVSSNVKENKTIFNGDNNGIVYLGAIFKEDQDTVTTVWNRKNSFELSPILKIAAEEELRISQKPLKIFDGSVYGQLPYLSVIEINGINTFFMPIEYSYDTMTNISKMKFLELFCPEISDLVYKFTFDYGNVVKPTIQG